MAEQEPTISVSRSVYHLLDDIAVDVDEMARFYDTLDHENKPPLNNLHFHIAAADSYFSGLRNYGYLVEGPLYHPEQFGMPDIPRIDANVIAIFIGSRLFDELLSEDGLNAESLSRGLNITATHELTHHAQSEGYNPPEDQLDALLDRFSYYRTRLGNYASEGLMTAQFYARPAIGGILGLALGAQRGMRGALTGLTGGVVAGAALHLRTADERIDELYHAGMDDYERDEMEIDAHARETDAFRIIRAVPRPVDELLMLRQQDLHYNITHTGPRRRDIHRARTLAMTPREDLPQNRYTTQ